MLTAAVLLAGACSSNSSPSSSSSPPATASGPLAYSQCMRTHGIANFPDPSPSGGIDIGPSSGIDPNSAQYHSADHACQALAAPAQSQAQQQQVYAYQLKYARCMQGHGVPNFPDPRPPGSGPVTNGNSAGSASNGSGAVDPNSSQFIAANKTCGHFLPAGQGPSTNSSGGGS